MARKPLKGGKAVDPRKLGKHPRLVPPRGNTIPPASRAGEGGDRRQITSFERILLDGMKKGVIPARSIEARQWFRKRAARLRVEPASLIEQDHSKLVGYPTIGKMFLFQYDPKWKEKLPYYDSFPLIFPIEPAKGGFLGINLHYLPPRLRAKLMDQLYNLVIMGKRPYDDKTKLGISYKILKAASKYEAFKPCIKHYLANHVRSRFMLIEPTEWDMAIMVPLARFRKASQQRVWADSQRIING